MTKRLLIDGTHAEETRVVVLDGNRLEDFDVETSTKKQLKGNIYLAKIVRVEPSLQAAFVEYGGNRHGFLAFGEIHPDYYQIPVADRQRLIAQQEQEAREAEAEEDRAAQADEASQLGESSGAGPTSGEAELVAAGDLEPESGSGLEVPDPVAEPGAEVAENVGEADEPSPAEPHADSPFADSPYAEAGEVDWPANPAPAAQPAAMHVDRLDGELAEDPERLFPANDDEEEYEFEIEITPDSIFTELGLQLTEDGEIVGDAEALTALAEALSGAFFEPSEPDDDTVETRAEPAGLAESASSGQSDDFAAEPGERAPRPETFGGNANGDERERRSTSARTLRSYKIQEVIRRRQIMLVQVVKEERGGKGAALTTYISLAGRFCVLMPNSPRGGGISRKITAAADRRRLKEITTELDIPSGMGLIVRTAGAARPKPEIKRDCEYLLQLWDDIRDTTMKSVAPAAIYEEASLIKRAIRDVYSRDVDEVQVDGEAAWHAARDQMRLLMPSHAHKVQLWHDPSGQKLFAHHQVDAQLDAMLSPTVQLKSGGYLVINQTEALVAIDVNSGRSTRERGIEETALRTNLEAAEEVARQLRLRDLAGLVVIDFIDMEARRHNAMVERKLQDALKNDRARIQLGSISPFGLMEMSRQRLRPSLAETSFVQCAHCSGTGLVRSTEGAAIHALRAIEEEGAKRKSAEVMVHMAGSTAMYILNHMRDRLREIEARYGFSVLFTPDAALLPPAIRVDKLRALTADDPLPVVAPKPVFTASPVELDAEDVEDEEDGAEETPEAVAAAPEQAAMPAGEGGDAGRRRRRRRRRGGRREDGTPRDGEALPVVAQPGAEQPDLGYAGGSDLVPVSGESWSGLNIDSPAALAAEQSGGDEIAASAAQGQDEGGGQGHLPPGDPGPQQDGGVDGSGQRRRGRRGGRRRHKETEGVPIAIAAAAPPAPSYAGPTPANPFGGGSFDIFDVLERAEALAAAQTLPAPPQIPPEVVAAAPAEAEPAEPLQAEVAAPEPVVAETVAAEAVLAEPEVVEAPPEPVAVKVPAAARVRAPRPSRAKPKVAAAPLLTEVSPEPAAEAVAPALSSEPAPDVPVSEPAAEPTVKPVLVDDVPPAPKRGWWKR